MQILVKIFSQRFLLTSPAAAAEWERVSPGYTTDDNGETRRKSAKNTQQEQRFVSIYFSFACARNFFFNSERILLWNVKSTLLILKQWKHYVLIFQAHRKPLTRWCCCCWFWLRETSSRVELQSQGEEKRIDTFRVNWVEWNITERNWKTINIFFSVLSSALGVCCVLMMIIFTVKMFFMV